MKKKLQLLEKLQLLDTAIDAKRHEQAGYQAVITELEQSVSVVSEGLKLEEDRKACLEAERAELENNLQAEVEGIKRSETNMKEIKTNKEYQAVGREITAAKKQISELEEQILMKTAMVEDLQALLDVKAAEFAKIQDDANLDIKEKLSLIKGLQTEIDSSLAERDLIVKNISSSVVRRYDQLRGQRRGQALAEAKDGSCQGCNINLPPQLYNTLFKCEELHFCPHCQRILILKQEPQQA